MQITITQYSGELYAVYKPEPESDAAGYCPVVGIGTDEDGNPAMFVLDNEGLLTPCGDELLFEGFVRGLPLGGEWVNGTWYSINGA